MPSLIDLRRRIRAVKSTQQITKAMKMVAASKLRRAQDRVQQARPFAAQMQRVLNSLAGRVDQAAHPLLDERTVPRAGGRALLFVITAVFVVASVMWSNPRNAMLGVILIAAGIPAFLFWRRQKLSPSAPNVAHPKFRSISMDASALILTFRPQKPACTRAITSRETSAPAVGRIAKNSSFLHRAKKSI